jgi:hypothetical protein
MLGTTFSTSQWRWLDSRGRREISGRGCHVLRRCSWYGEAIFEQSPFLAVQQKRTIKVIIDGVTKQKENNDGEGRRLGDIRAMRVDVRGYSSYSASPCQGTTVFWILDSDDA